MIPSSISAAALFFLLVAPGLLAEQRRLRWESAAKRSTAQEAGLIVLWSTVYTILGSAVVLAASSRIGLGFNHLNRALIEDNYRKEQLTVLLSQLVLVTVAALVLVMVTDWIRRIWAFSKYTRAHSGSQFWPWPWKWRKFKQTRHHWIMTTGQLVERSMWSLALVDDCPPGAFPVARISLKSGQTFIGDVRSFDPDLGYDGREIALQQPIHVESQSRLLPVDESWQQVLFASDAIDSISIRYETQSNSQSRPAINWAPSATVEAEFPASGSLRFFNRVKAIGRCYRVSREPRDG